MDISSSSVQACPFNVLPIELRLMIYRIAFRGSRITYINRKGHVRQDLTERSRESAFITTEHWAPLLTCRQFYVEGLAEYWRETRLDATRAGIVELTEHLSGPAKTHVRHIRRLELPLEGAPTVSRCLAQYGELRTCELHIVTTDLAREITREVEAPKLAPGEVHEGVVSSADPRRLLREHHLVKDGVRFVAQLDIMHQIHGRIMIPLEEFNIHGTVITFLDLTTGRFRSVLWEGRDDVLLFYYPRIGREVRRQWDEEQYEILFASNTGVHSHHNT